MDNGGVDKERPVDDVQVEDDEEESEGELVRDGVKKYNKEGRRPAKVPESHRPLSELKTERPASKCPCADSVDRGPSDRKR